MPKTNPAVEKKLVGLADVVIDAAARKKDPSIPIPVRALSNVKFNEKRGIIEMGSSKQQRTFFNMAMAKKFMQTMLVADALNELQKADLTTSLREIYYRTKHTMGDSHENTFDDQAESDPVIEDLEVSTDSLREELHLFANRKGAMVGNLVINDSGDDIDLSRLGSGGWAIPSICEPSTVKFVRNKAEYVLFVEKEAMFSRFNEDKFWRTQNCILMTSGGQATRGARRLLQRLATELKIPVYVVVDNDPWGLYIYSVLKQGSISLAYESMRLAVPGVRFIGMSALDYKKFKLPKAVEIKLADKDIARAKEMKAYPWFADKKWQREIDATLDNGFKMEVDSFLTKGVSFISEEYLPKKLKDRDWLT